METMETLSIKVHSLEKAQEKQELTNNDIFMKIDTKVSYKVFWSINLIFITVLIAVLGYIAVRQDSIDNKVSSEDTKISYMTGVFQNNNFKSSP